MKLERDIDQAKRVLSSPILSLKGLLLIRNSFLSAKMVCDEFVLNHNDLSYQLRIACTKSIVSDYYRPWSGNFNNALKCLQLETKRDFSYPFLEAVVNKPEHAEIQELRNQLVVHANEGSEGLGVTLKGMRVLNVPQQENTIEDAFQPIQIRLSSVRGVWWISEIQKIKSFQTHFDFAIEVIDEQIRKAAQHFRDACFHFMHVVHKLGDFLGVEELTIEAGTAILQNHDQTMNPLHISDPSPIKIGNQNIVSLVVVYEPSPLFPDDLDIVGRGYRLKTTEVASGSAQIQVSFPKYPYPKLGGFLKPILYYSKLYLADEKSLAVPLRNLEGLLRNQALFNPTESEQYLNWIKTISIEQVTLQSIREVLHEIYNLS